MNLTADQLQSRAELYLCLSRAFLTPDSTDAWIGMSEALADDMQDLGDEIGYDFAESIANYRTAIAAVPDQPSLLQIYSGLFLAPPRLVEINTGTYLDGSLNGGSVLAMEEEYRRCGVGRSDDFQDLSDHVSIQLGFIAHLYFRCLDALGEDQSEAADDDPAQFLHAYVARWLPAFIHDLGQESERLGAFNNPYLHLARLLSVAVAKDACAQPVSASEQRTQNAIGKARHDRAERGISAGDMAIIAQKLSEKGLSIDHLSVPPAQRDEAQGLTKRVTPSARRGSRLG